MRWLYIFLLSLLQDITQNIKQIHHDMKHLSAFVLALSTLVPSMQSKAQTNDLNLILSPTIGYTTWSQQVNFGSTAYWGARVGWSFGQNIELYGTYDRTFDLQGKLREGKWNVLDQLANRLEGSKVQMERWGGEAKVNILPNTLFTPYVLGGAGVMNISHDALEKGQSDYREERLYAVLGVGAKFNLARRLTLGLEARNTLFNLDEDSHYRNTLHTGKGTLHNWSVAASLNAYLGGNNRAKTPFEKAMQARYSGGLRGLVWAVEPTVAHINFSNSSQLHDQWLLGVSAGVDFSPVLGLRGFYYTSTQEPGKLSLKLDQDLQLYGAQFIGRLNYLRGLTPYLTVGGGYMDVSRDYVGRGGQAVESGWFAQAGAGLEMPIHRYASLFGSVSAMLAQGDNPDLDKAYRPSQVQANWLYQLGVRFRIGKSAKDANELYTQYAAADLARQRSTEWQAQQAAKAQQPQQDAKRVDTVEVIPATKLVPAQKRETVLLTAAQLNTLIDRVVAESRAKAAAAPVGLSDLDKILLFALINNGHTVPATVLNGSVLPQGTIPSSISPEEVVLLRQRIAELEKALLDAQKTQQKRQAEYENELRQMKAEKAETQAKASQALQKMKQEQAETKAKLEKELNEAKQETRP